MKSDLKIVELLKYKTMHYLINSSLKNKLIYLKNYFFFMIDPRLKHSSRASGIYLFGA